VNAPLQLRLPPAVRAQRGASRRDSRPGAAFARARWAIPLLFAVLLIASADLGLRALGEVANVPIRQVSVNGDFRFLDKRRVEEIMLPHLGTGYFMVDLAAIRDELQRLPLVHEVTVRRAWPDRLLVFITEQVPVLRFGEDAYLNPYAEVFHPGAPLAGAELPMVSGPEGSGKLLLARFDSFTETLEPTRLRLATLALDGKHAWRLTLSNGIEVLLGRRQVEAKLQMLSRLLATEWKDAQGRIARIDMRYSNGVAVAWKDGAPPAGPTAKGMAGTAAGGPRTE
jgi:cell division protein FtsQ